MNRRRLLLVVGISTTLYLLLRSKKAAAAAAPPAVAGEVDSGSQSATFNTNVLSPTFGLPINPN